MPSKANKSAFSSQLSVIYEYETSKIDDSLDDKKI